MGRAGQKMYVKPASAMIAMTMTGHDNDCHRKYSYRPSPAILRMPRPCQAGPWNSQQGPCAATPAPARPSKGPNRPAERFYGPCQCQGSLTMRKRLLGPLLRPPMRRPASRGHGPAQPMMGYARAHAFPRRARAWAHGGARVFGVGLAHSHTRHKFDFAFQD